MKRITAIASILSLSLLIASCSKAPTIDASSPGRMKQTSDIIRAGLAGDELQKYDQAVTLIIASVLDPIDTINLASQGAIPTKASVFERIKPSFDGLNHDEIIKHGDQAASIVKIKIADWQQKRNLLQSRFKAYQRSAVIMQKVTATEVNLRPIDSVLPGIGVNQVMLEITVSNGLDAPLKDAKFLVALMPAGINNPWVTQPFSKSFAPIAPGGSERIEVGPITVSIPEQYKGPVTLETQIEFSRLQPVGQSPLVLPSWNEYDVIELSKLESAIVEIENVLTLTPPVAKAN